MQRLEWLTKMSWNEMPFNPSDVTIEQKYIVGFDEIKDKLYGIVDERRNFFVFLFGPYGAGKTTMLNWLEDKELRQGSMDVVLFRGPPTRNEIVERVHYLYGPKGPIGQLQSTLGLYPKMPNTIHDVPEFLNIVSKNKKKIFLVDEVEKCQNAELQDGLNDLKMVVEATQAICVVAGIPEGERYVPASIISREGERMQMRNMTENEIRELIEARITSVGGKGISPFSEDAIRTIYTLSSGAPRVAISLCQKAVENSITAGVLEVNTSDIIKAREEISTSAPLAVVKQIDQPAHMAEGTLKEKVLQESFLGNLSNYELGILKLVYAEPNLTVNEMAEKLNENPKVTRNKILILLGRVEERKKEGVPYPLLVKTKKGNVDAYRLVAGVERYFGEK